uniref:Uncharacterized protein n=1 Tax=Rhizophora mucronata TaxID=61149 RepID=A0A2P2QAC2_RHIMU
MQGYSKSDSEITVEFKKVASTIQLKPEERSKHRKLPIFMEILLQY